MNLAVLSIVNFYGVNNKLPATLRSPSSEFTPEIKGTLLKVPSFRVLIGSSLKNVFSSLYVSTDGTNTVIGSRRGN